LNVFIQRTSSTGDVVFLESGMSSAERAIRVRVPKGARPGQMLQIPVQGGQMSIVKVNDCHWFEGLKVSYLPHSFRFSRNLDNR
jgi:hypothetical protein